jgi:T5SS/PEP-CTERM-associated repeat protein
MRPGILAVLAALVLHAFGVLETPRAHATITTLGNVNPTPPAGGGNVSGVFYVGDTSYGQLSVFIPQPPGSQTPTPINVIGGNSSVFGDDARVTGTGAFTGFGNNFTVAEDIALGRAGSGNLSASGLSRITASDDFLLAIEDGSSGRLFVNDLGTIVEAIDDFIVGQGGTALVQALSGSRVFAESTIVGQNATADGTVTVSGNETLWLQTGSMTIGSSGRGYLQIVSQGRMETSNVLLGSNASGVGSGNVSGTGSLWDVSGTVTVGLAGEGSLTVTDGARLSNTGASRIATVAGGEGTALVSGVNSVWNSGSSLTIGETGVGVLRMLAGGRVNAGNTILSSVTGSRGELIVDGIGTVFDVTGTLAVGNVPTAEALMTVSSGGVANVSGATSVGAAAEVFMGGGRLNAAGGLTNQGVVRGAGRINGAFTNAAAGDIRTQAGSSLVLGNNLANSGLVNLTGGELEVLGATTNSGDIDVRSAIARFGGGLSNNANAQLAVVGGDADVFGAITNALNAQIVVGGGATAVFHDAVTNNGQIFVQPGSNILMLENLSFTASSLLSLTLGEESLEEQLVPVEVNGQATLAGVLDVQLGSEVTPQLGDSFQLVSAPGGLAGAFAPGDLPSLTSGLEWDLDYTPTSLTLSVVSGTGGPTADFDGDGDVDGADLNVWRGDFGMPGAQADADGDGDADGSDFLAWQKQVGNTGAAPAANAIPEPASAMLLTLALAGLAARTRRRS